MKRWTTAMTLALLVACAPGPIAAPPTQMGPVDPTAPAASVPVAKAPTATASALAVEGEGLRLFDRESGRARAISFGMARSAVIAALSFRGPPVAGRQEDCGAGSLDYAAWPDGLKLYFQRGNFTGWALDLRAGGALNTASGVGPGSSRGDLESAYSVKVVESTLGTEFTAGPMAGLLDGPGSDAKIEAMWAGTSCNFR